MHWLVEQTRCASTQQSEENKDTALPKSSFLLFLLEHPSTSVSAPCYSAIIKMNWLDMVDVVFLFTYREGLSFTPAWCQLSNSKFAALPSAFLFFSLPHKPSCGFFHFLITAMSLYVMKQSFVIGCVLIVLQASSTLTKWNWCVKAACCLMSGSRWRCLNVFKHVPLQAQTVTANVWYILV